MFKRIDTDSVSRREGASEPSATPYVWGLFICLVFIAAFRPDEGFLGLSLMLTCLYCVVQIFRLDHSKQAEAIKRVLLALPVLSIYTAMLPLVLIFLCKPCAIGCLSFEEEWECEY